MIKSTTFFALLFLSFFGGLTSCQKDESALNDYDLFGRLQFGSGTWELVEVQNFDNSVANPTITTTQPTSKTVYHYYMRTILISSVIIDVPTVTIYYDQNLGPIYEVEAELERVVYRAGEIFGGTVFTVLENKPNRQVWTYTEGSTTTQYTFEKCKCEIPVLNISENGG